MLLVAIVIGLIAHRPNSTATCKRSGGLPECPVTLQFIRSRPESSLYYPGAAVVLKNSQGEEHFVGSSPNAATVDTVLASDAPQHQIQAWYTAQLTMKGWHTADATALSPAGISGQGYARDTRESFVLSFDTISLLTVVYHIPPKTVSAIQGKTLFETNYLIAPASS
jgi:hypothetical protein